MQLLPETDDFAQKRATFRRKGHARFLLNCFLKTVRCGTRAFAVFRHSRSHGLLFFRPVSAYRNR